MKLEPEISLLTVTRRGSWSIDTVRSYGADLRRELAILHQGGGPTAFIIDIRPSGPQAKPVADALRAMVRGLGPLHADKTAVVTSSSIAKLEAVRVADTQAQVFTSMVLARDWVTQRSDPAPTSGRVESKPSDADAVGSVVHVRGPADVDITFTPVAALETAERIADAATEALINPATPALYRPANSEQEAVPND